MAIDYKTLRNYLDTGDLLRFRQYLTSDIVVGTASAAYQAANATGAAQKNFQKQYTDFISSAISDINKYITNDPSLSGLSQNITNAITGLSKGATMATASQAIQKAIAASMPSNTKYQFQAASNQAGTSLDVSGLVDIYNTKGQDAYRSELANRINAFNTAAGINATSIGGAFTGDARFDSNTLGESLKSAAASLQSISTQTQGDLSASKLASIYSGGSTLGYLDKGLASYTGDTKNITTGLNTLDKTQTTITAETDAKQALEAKRKQLLKQTDSGGIGIQFNNSLSIPQSQDNSTLGQQSTYGKS